MAVVLCVDMAVLVDVRGNGGFHNSQHQRLKVLCANCDRLACNQQAARTVPGWWIHV